MIQLTNISLPLLVVFCRIFVLFLLLCGLCACDKDTSGQYLIEPPAENTSSSSTSSSSSSSSSSTSSSGAVVGPEENPVTVTVDVINPNLSADGETAITLAFSDSQGAPVLVFGTWEASSPCVVRGGAEISPAVKTSTTVSFNYAATGCVGEDVVTFTGVESGKVYTVATTLSLAEEEIGLISWTGTVPQQIAIRGSGGQEQAQISFRVNGVSSGVLAGQQVNFRLEGGAGGVSLLTESAVSNASGVVNATVLSGTSPALVTVVAEHTASGVRGYSGGLIVANGLASDSHFNIALSIRNPFAYNWINEQTSDVVVAVTDKSGNAVVDGTVVNFVAEEGGSIQSSCGTKAGTCTVTWTPDGRFPLDGRVQIFSSVKGTEDFVDNNGNKIFDAGDDFPAQYDLGEPYSDNNTNGDYDIGEHFVDSNGNGVRDPSNAVWNGLNCKHPTLCADVAEFVDLGSQTTLYMSDGRDFEICALGEFADPTKFVFPVEGAHGIHGLYLSDGNTHASNPGPGCLQGNPLPAGTTIRFSVSAGSLRGTTSWVVPDNATQPTGPYSINYKAPEEAGQELLTLTVVVPGLPAQSTEFELQIQ